MQYRVEARFQAATGVTFESGDSSRSRIANRRIANRKGFRNLDLRFFCDLQSCDLQSGSPDSKATPGRDVRITADRRAVVVARALAASLVGPASRRVVRLDVPNASFPPRPGTPRRLRAPRHPAASTARFGQVGPGGHDLSQVGRVVKKRIRQQSGDVKSRPLARSGVNQWDGLRNGNARSVRGLVVPAGFWRFWSGEGGIRTPDTVFTV